MLLIVGTKFLAIQNLVATQATEAQMAHLFIQVSGLHGFYRRKLVAQVVGTYLIIREVDLTQIMTFLFQTKLMLNMMVKLIHDQTLYLMVLSGEILEVQFTTHQVRHIFTWPLQNNQAQHRLIRFQMQGKLINN